MYQYLLNKFYTLDYEDVKDTVDFKIIAQLQRHLQEPPKSSSTKQTIERYHNKQNILSAYFYDYEWIPLKPSFSSGELWIIYDLIHELPKYSNIDLRSYDPIELVERSCIGYKDNANVCTLDCIYGICDMLDIFCFIPEPRGYKNKHKKKESEINASIKK